MTSPLTKSQWLGLGIMVAIIAVFIGSFYLIDHVASPKEEAVVEVDSVLMSRIEVVQETKRGKNIYKVKTDTVELRLHKFDPNTADSIELLEVGFRPWMVKNMQKYKEKGGRWRTKESVKKIYGMTDELYEQIEPYIEIAEVKDTVLAQTWERVYQEKKDTVFELNSCDTAELKYLRGIGGGYARRIVRYRRELGGYVKVEQLWEIKEIPKETIDSIIPHFIVNCDSVRTIDVNRASVGMLERHPYLSFSQAKAIYELRRTRFRLKGIEDLGELDCLTETEIERIAPYLSFGE